MKKYLLALCMVISISAMAHVHVTGHVRIVDNRQRCHRNAEVTLQTPWLGAGIDIQSLGIDANVSRSHEELEFSTDRPLFVQLVTVTAADLRIDGSTAAQTGEAE